MRYYGEEYFAAVRAALLQARKQILIAGWDFDTRTVLPPREGDDGSSELHTAPLQLGELLGYLRRTRPQLEIQVTRWAYPWIYRDDREVDTREQLERMGVTFHEDRGHPVTGSVHHKLIVIDGALAFCGGMDLTHERWRGRTPRTRGRAGAAARLLLHVDGSMMYGAFAIVFIAQVYGIELTISHPYVRVERRLHVLDMLDRHRQPIAALGNGLTLTPPSLLRRIERSS